MCDYSHFLMKKYFEIRVQVFQTDWKLMSEPQHTTAVFKLVFLIHDFFEEEVACITEEGLCCVALQLKCICYTHNMQYLITAEICLYLPTSNYSYRSF